MEQVDTLFEAEVQRTLRWASKHPNEWNKIVRPEEFQTQELVDIIDTLIEEKLYSLLVMFITNEFVDYYGMPLMRRIVVEVLLSQWSESTLDIMLKAIRQTICEYLESRNAPKELLDC